MMKRSLILVLSLLMLVLCIPALAESTDWNYDANYAILRGYDGAGGDVVVPAEIDGFTVDVIGINVFKGDTITSLTLPETVLELRSGAVASCERLASVTLPQSLVVINRMNFFSCNALSEITIPAGVRYIGDGSFRFCDALRKITFEGVCPAIDMDCFSILPEDAVAYVPDDQLEAYTAAFENAGSTVSVQPSGKNAVVVENNGYVESEFDFDASTGTITAYNGYATYLSIPETIGGAPVKAIGPEAFARHTYLAFLELPEGLEHIGERAFYNCETLGRVKFPSTLKTIGSNAFYNAYKSSVLELTSVESIGDYAFYFAGLKGSLELPEGLKSIGESAFENCAALKRITLPKSITKLEASCFSGCTALAEIALPDGVKTLGEKVFSGCAALKSVKIPAEVTVIPTEAFFGCSSLESITIPKSVSHINERAFDGCTALKKVDYLGSDTDWSQVTKETCNNALNNAEKSFTRTDHEHKYTDTVIPPTCTERGCTVHLCACGDKREDSYTPPLGHSYRDGICVRCGILDPNRDTQHEHDFIPTVTKPTCLTEGFTTYACSCGECYTKDYVSAVGHKTQLQNAKAAGCMTGGYTGDEVCTFCGKVFTQGSVIFALGHDPQPARVKAPTCNESGYTGDLICMRCGDMTQIGNTVAATGHKFFGGVCSVCGAKGAEAVPEFDDVKPGAFYFDAVQWAVKNGITNGTGKNTFSPNSVCSRYQIVMFLWRAAGQPEAKAAVSFADVKPGDIFYEAVQWAVERGITKGTSSTSFSPFAPCTRGQIVTFLYRSAGSPKVSGACDFSDVSAGSFCHDAVIWASSEGITKGTSAGRFSPNEGCTRAQVVTFLYRASGGK